MWESDVVLADGGVVHVRPLRADDRDALDRFYARVSDASRRGRFFLTLSPGRASELERSAPLDFAKHCVLVAELGDTILAVGRYDREDRADDAEVAFTVRDDHHGRGIGTILLEHLAVVARAHGVRRFVAQTLPSNVEMLRVFADVGFDVQRSLDRGVVDVAFDIAPIPSLMEAQEAREHTSEARSIARLLAPRSLAVIGASASPGSIGHAIMRNLLSGEYAGPVYPVNPHAESVGGVRAYASVLDVPDAVDVAILVVPAQQVLAVTHECVSKGVRGLVVISAGFGEVAGGRDRERELVELARRYGLRVVGPNCMGVLNASPAVRMNATFAPVVPEAGRIAFASQSGGLGIALLARARELGLGISTFVSMGNKADVSSNDLIQYWEDDPDTDVILLYLESFGNPRKFARLARRIGQRKPIVAVKGGRTTAGARGTSSHTAALASPDVAVDAVFRQAGVIRVDTLEELFDTARVLEQQPLPGGRRVGIVSNGGGPGILAADACINAGLEVPVLSVDSQEALQAVTASGAAVANPIDLIASATAQTYEQVTRMLLASHEVDALLVIFVAPLVTRSDDVARALESVVAGAASAKPVVACFLGRDDALDGAAPTALLRSVPAFTFPEAAARALGRIAEHAEWRKRPAGTEPELCDVDVDAARAKVRDFLAEHPEGGWLQPTAVQELLASFGVGVAPMQWVGSASDAATAASSIGYPVALKAGAGELVHKSDVGGVRLGLTSSAAVRNAFRDMHADLGERMGGAVVQPMVDPGVETIVGVTHDASFGPLVLFGIGGFAAELTRDTSVCLAPLTDLDAHELVRSLRTSPLLFGYRNSPQVDVGALEDLLVRVGALANLLPEIVELDCNPVIVASTGATVVDAKVHVAPAQPTPPGELRHLRAVR